METISQPHITPEGLMSASRVAISHGNGTQNSPDRSIEDLQHKPFCKDLSRQNYYLQQPFNWTHFGLK
jgi:hypothetical protein